MNLRLEPGYLGQQRAGEDTVSPRGKRQMFEASLWEKWEDQQKLCIASWKSQTLSCVGGGILCGWQ